MKISKILKVSGNILGILLVVVMFAGWIYAEFKIAQQTRLDVDRRNNIDVSFSVGEVYIGRLYISNWDGFLRLDEQSPESNVVIMEIGEKYVTVRNTDREGTVQKIIFETWIKLKKIKKGEEN